MSSESQSECSICTEIYTKSTRKKVTCPNNKCKHEVCVVCVKNYMKYTVNDAHCMECKFGWTYEFLGSFLTKTYLNGEYKKNRENILVDREMNLLPQSQEAAERVLKNREINLIIDPIRNEIKEILDKKRIYDVELSKKLMMCHTNGDKKVASAAGVCKKNIPLLIKIVELEDEIANKRHIINSYVKNDDNNINTFNKKERKVFIKSCPAEECRGFLSTQWKCGICEVHVCSKCHEIIEHTKDDKDANHKCNPNSVKTAKMLKKDSKGCPKCGVMIYKIEGCDQMWCTSCNTAFSWNSMKILVNNTVHNPHYFEYLRRMNNGEIMRNPLDIQCGGLPNAQVVSGILNRLQMCRMNNHNIVVDTIMYFLQRVIHIEQIEIQETYRIRDNNSNEDLRIKYLLKDIDKDQMKKTIVRRENKNNHNQMISQILNMFVNVVNDIIRRILQKVRENNIIPVPGPKVTGDKDIIREEITKVSNNILDIYTKETAALRDYYNECMQNMSKQFNMTTPRLDDKWQIKKLKT